MDEGSGGSLLSVLAHSNFSFNYKQSDKHLASRSPQLVLTRSGPPEGKLPPMDGGFGVFTRVAVNKRVCNNELFLVYLRRGGGCVASS